MYNFHTIEKKKQVVGNILVKNAKYLNDYKLRIFFTDGYESEVDFANFLFSKKGYLTKYQKPSNFKKFKIHNGNLVWGRDWDLIFPLDQLYEGVIKD